MSFRDDLTRALAEMPERLLPEWLWWLQTVARGFYPEAGASEEEARRGLAGFNELGLVMTAQLRSLGSPEPAYPVSVLVDTLNEKASAYGVGRDLRWSAEQALERVGSDSG